MSPQVDFYVLGKVDAIGKLKYACRIAQKAYHKGLKVFLQTCDNEQSIQLDSLLWTFSQGSFIPHVIASLDSQNWKDFPVQLGSGQIVSNEKSEWADVLISLVEEVPVSYDRFTRIVDLIADDPEEKLCGRERFRFYKANGIEPNTHQVA